MKEFTNEQLLKLHNAGASIETLMVATGVKEQRIKTLLRYEANRQKHLLEKEAEARAVRELLSSVVVKINADWSKNDLFDYLEPRLKAIGWTGLTQIMVRSK